MRLSIHANLACSQATTLSIALDAAKDTVEKLPQENAGVETMNSAILVLDSRLRSTNDASNVREFSLRKQPDYFAHPFDQHAPHHLFIVFTDPPNLDNGKTPSRLFKPIS